MKILVTGLHKGGTGKTLLSRLASKYFSDKDYRTLDTDLKNMNWKKNPQKMLITLTFFKVLMASFEYINLYIILANSKPPTNMNVLKIC